MRGNLIGVIVIKVNWWTNLYTRYIERKFLNLIREKIDFDCEMSISIKGPNKDNLVSIKLNYLMNYWVCK